jgi:hypothetical protein
MNQARGFIGSIVFLYMFLPCSHARAQAQDAISGIVVDSLTLRALPSVNVQIKGETRGTVTDEKGNFSIMAASRDTLVFTLVGYTSVELPLDGYEPGIIRMSEKYTLLEAVTIDEYRGGELYEGMFEERNAQLRKRIPFYFSKARKEKIKVQSLQEENIRVKTYVDIVINDPALKNRLMATYALSEDEYYDMLTAFNEKHYRVMYYLTPAELISLINSFFEAGNR